MPAGGALPKRILAAGAALCLIAIPTAAFAADAAPPPDAGLPAGGFFAGAGVSYNSVHLDQDFYGVGVTEVYEGDTLAGFGKAEGPAPPFHDTDHGFAPDLQAGYFGPLTDAGDWLWGFKAAYKYTGASLTNRGIDSPQTGTIVTLYPTPEEGSLTGNALLKSSQTRIDHEFLFVPFIGHSFSSSFLYVGAGPALFGTRSELNDLVGLADINGNKFNLTGTPIDFSSTKWMWGGAVQVGMTYFLSESWFLDMNYTYARSEKYKESYSAPFTNVVDGDTYEGSVFVDTHDKITSQGVVISINTLF
jgi:opacity protein-like surface antigen